VTDSSLWPTPRAYSFKDSHTPGLTLLDIRVRGLYQDKPRYWPTPTARDWRSGKGAVARKGHAQPLTDVIGGMLNPVWVEWLMGFPPGWTDLED
jgi:hypothetical protein